MCDCHSCITHLECKKKKMDVFMNLIHVCIVALFCAFPTYGTASRDFYKDETRGVHAPVRETEEELSERLERRRVRILKNRGLLRRQRLRAVPVFIPSWDVGRITYMQKGEFAKELPSIRTKQGQDVRAAIAAGEFNAAVILCRPDNEYMFLERCHESWRMCDFVIRVAPEPEFFTDQCDRPS